MSQSVADGQLPTSVAALYTVPLTPPQLQYVVSLSVFNTSATPQTVQVTVTRAASGATRNVHHAVLAQYERFVLQGVPMSAGDAINGATTTASVADYVVTTSQQDVPFSAVTFDASGNFKQNQAASGNFTVGANLTVNGTYITTSYATPAAAGSTQGTATAVTAANNLVTVGSANAGVLLPSTAVLGQEISIMNASASNAMKVYSDGTGTINGGSASAAKTLAAATGATYLCVSAGPNAQWYSLSN